jgi:hypothetical protein
VVLDDADVVYGTADDALATALSPAMSEQCKAECPCSGAGHDADRGECYDLGLHLGLVSGVVFTSVVVGENARMMKEN